MKILPLIAIVALLLSGCVTESARDRPSWIKPATSPFKKRPALYARMEAEGVITPERREALIQQWKAQKPLWESEQRAKAQRAVALKKVKKEHDRWVASLNPAQKLDVKMREREAKARQKQFNAQATSQAQPQGTPSPPSQLQDHAVLYPPSDPGEPQ